MGDQLERFKERAFEIDSLGEIELVVPPTFGESAIEEFVDDDSSNWASLKRQKINDILDSIPDNRDPLAHLQEKEHALLKAVEKAETEQERRIAELEDKLRRSIRHCFQDASEGERNHFFRWVRHGRESLHRMSMDLLESGQISDPDSIPAPPKLWKEVEDKDQWRKVTEKFHHTKAAVRRLKFSLGMVQIVKRIARSDALDKLRDDLQKGLTPEKRRKLRGIAEEYTDEVKAVRDYLDQCPEHAWPKSRTAAFDAIFPEEGRKVYERFRRRWERARDLNFPDTVKKLHEECKIALKLRDDFGSVEST